MPDFLPTSWVLGTEPKDTDYMIGSNMIPITIQSAPYADNIVVEANQNREQRYVASCVIHACAWAICDFWNESYETYIEFIRLSVDEAVRTGVIDLARGMNVSDGVDVCRRIWNAWKPEKAINSFRIPYADPVLDEVMKKWHSLATAYRGNREWEDDVNTDGILNKGYYAPTTYAHSVRARRSKTNAQIVNSYKGVVPHNIYGVPLMYSLVTNGMNFWDCFYVFLPKEWQDDTTEKMLLAVKLWIWSGDRPNDVATRWECATMIARKIHWKLATASVIIPLVWNGQEPNREPTQTEFNAMFERAWLTAPVNMTRGAIAIALVS